MEHNRKQKLLMIVALIAGIASLSIGFAAFSATLNISSSASVTPNSDTFSVKFSTNKDNLVVKPLTPTGATANVPAGTGTINNTTNPTVTGLSASFTRPGEYITYTFYARNEGDYTAYLNSVNFLGEKVCTAGEGATEQLVQSACEKVTLYVQVGTTGYLETTQITGHSLAPNESDTIKVILNYESDAPLADGPFTVKFQDVALVYSTIDDSSIQPVIPSEKVAQLVSGDLNTPGSIVAIGDEEFYIIGQENETIKLLTRYNLRVGFYHEGEVYLGSVPEPIGIQDSEAIGWHHEFVEGDLVLGVMGCYLDTINEYLANYKNYIEEIGVPTLEVRMINTEELSRLGCSTSSLMCENANYAWVYSTAYWTGISYDDTKHYAVKTNGTFKPITNSSNMGYGVRPVIVLSKSEL